MANIITLDPKVGRFEKALARWRRMAKLSADYVFTPADMVRMQWTTLQLEGDATRTGATLQTRKGNMNTDNPDARLLDTNDVFVATAMAMFIRRYSIVNGVKSYSLEPLMTYPSKRYFKGAKSGKTPEFKALMSFFNGTHTLKTGTTTLIDSASNLNFLKVPNAPYVAENEDYAEFDIDKIVVALPSLLAMYGTNPYELSIKYGSAPDHDLIDGSVKADGTDNEDSRNQVVVVFEGLRIVGGSQAQLLID